MRNYPVYNYSYALVRYPFTDNECTEQLFFVLRCVWQRRFVELLTSLPVLPSLVRVLAHSQTQMQLVKEIIHDGSAKQFS